MALNISSRVANLPYFTLHHFSFKGIHIKEYTSLLDSIYEQLYEKKAQIISCILSGDVSGFKTLNKNAVHVFGEINWPVLWFHNSSKQLYSGSFVAVSGVNVKTFMGQGFITKMFETPLARYVYTGEICDTNKVEILNENVLQPFQQPLSWVGMGLENLVRVANQGDHDFTDEIALKRSRAFTQQANLPEEILKGSKNPMKHKWIGSFMGIEPKDKSITIDKITFTNSQNSIQYHGISINESQSKILSLSSALEAAMATHEDAFSTVESQVNLAITTLSEVLATEGMPWNSLWRGIAYFKDLNDAAVFKEACKQKKIPLSAIIMVEASFFNEKLFFDFEIELVK